MSNLLYLTNMHGTYVYKTARNAAGKIVIAQLTKRDIMDIHNVYDC